MLTGKFINSKTILKLFSAQPDSSTCTNIQ